MEKFTKPAWLPLLTQDNHWKDTLVIIYLKKSIARNKILIVIVWKESWQTKDIRTRINLMEKRETIKDK